MTNRTGKLIYETHRRRRSEEACGLRDQNRSHHTTHIFHFFNFILFFYFIAEIDGGETEEESGSISTPDEQEAKQMTGMDIPLEILEAAQKVADWCETRGWDEYEISGLCSRKRLNFIEGEMGRIQRHTSEIVAANVDLCARVSRIRTVAVEVLKELSEMPSLVLSREQKNPAWSKAELWGIERDILPTIFLACNGISTKIKVAIR